jgi:hypothetical protein
VPIPPPTYSVPFDAVDTAMNSARKDINDCPLGLSGNLLADTQPYAQQFYNDGWRQFQRDLSEYSPPELTNEFWSPSLPPVASIDPVVQTYLGQAAYFDGQNFWVPPQVNLLPQDCLYPLHVRERLGGSQQLFNEVTPCDNGLPQGPKTTFIRYWYWRSAGPGNGNAIFMPGATVPRDLWVNYAAFLPDAVDNRPIPLTPWYGQPIPILRCNEILGLYVAAEFAFSRGSDQAKAAANSFWSEGKTRMRQYVNSTVMKQRQRINHRRRPYSIGRHRGWQWW